ncbi:MAG: 50S ribosomal protein L3 [Desulfobacteraceae bacterium]|nr:50S ribosomal protein L3 [Desulfobacteraceae bacterium]
MSTGILGKKVGMTSIFESDGRLVPVTVVKAGPCVVTQIKNIETDGYTALQIGFEEIDAKKINKPDAGHFEKSGGKGFSTLREFRVDNIDDYELGQVLDLGMFSVGDKVVVSGISKGRGFQGTIKRHGFSRGPETHGSRNHRAPGSIGQSAWPARVIKGKRMPGRMGNDRVTLKNLKVIDIKPEDNVILIKGAIPGSKTGIVELKKVD